MMATLVVRSTVYSSARYGVIDLFSSHISEHCLPFGLYTFQFEANLTSIITDPPK